MVQLSYPLEKEIATHSSILAWRIPWMEEPARLQSMGCIKSDKTEGLDGSYPYVTIGKTIALTRRTLVSKVISLLLNMLRGDGIMKIYLEK